MPVLTTTIMLLTIPPVMAIDSSQYAKVAKHEPYNKDGKYWMGFTVKNMQGNLAVSVYAKLLNSSGTELLSWSPERVPANQAIKRNYSIDFSNYASGTTPLNCWYTLQGWKPGAGRIT